MAAKATEHEKILRVHDVYQKLVTCWSSADICQYASARWGIDDRSTYRYIAEARERLKANCSLDQSEWIAQKMATLEQMARAELEGSDDGTTTGNRLAALQFIRTQAQFIQVI
mgnify:CR=1 FL=1|tara:strand:- start:12 stop:350 length:339 start_codon:yes stop_codon:yes gene_type:complete